MIDAIPLLLAPEGYQISRSVRLRSSASATFSRTPASAGNTTKGTFSFWIKRGALSTAQQIYHVAGTSGNNSRFFLAFNVTTDTFSIVGYNSAGAVALELVTTQVFRDPSSWYHIVIYIDTTQASSSNRVILYINGAQVSSFGTSTIPAQNTALGFTNNTASLIGANQGSTNFFDGYLTEINFIDGQALTPSSFGETNQVTGVWQPRKYTGTYGTNGFYLNFSDNSNNTAATIGKDFSGNGNNWTPNNISVTAGVTFDSMLDVPTQWADGGNGRGNYCVLNPLSSNANMTITGGNLNVTSSSASQSFNAYSSIAVLTDKYYVEATINTGSVADMIGVCPSTLNAASARFDGLAGGVGYYMNGNKYVASVSSAYGASYTTGDVIGIALDMDAQTVAFYKNGVSQGTISSSLTANVPYYFVTGDAAGTAGINQSFNFGQRPFAYTPPTGFRALNTQNLPTPTILKGNQFFDVNLWSGNASTQSIVNAAAMQPDLVWIKKRAGGTTPTRDHRLFDAVRGATLYLSSNTTGAETTETDGLTAFNANGFTLGASDGVNGTTGGTGTYVGWQWKEGPTQGFDIVTYTGTGTGGTTIGHGLGVSPAMIIIKSRNNATNWMVWHQNLAANFAFEGLNTTGAAVSGGSPSKYVRSVSSTLVTIGNDISVNQSASYTYVMYCFAEVAGFSRFGSYTGNGSADGPFVFCGFRPRFVMTKRTDTTSAWIIWDTARDTINVAGAALFPNLSNAEIVATNLDILSNGFKMRNTGTDYNASGGTYIFAAFAENPFKNALAR